MRFKAKVDSNHNQIVDSLRAVGCNVLSLAAIGKGAPDILVCYHEKLYLMEIKASKGKLTPCQVKFHGEWRGPIYIIKSTEEAFRIIGIG